MEMSGASREEAELIVAYSYGEISQQDLIDRSDEIIEIKNMKDLMKYFGFKSQQEANEYLLKQDLTPPKIEELKLGERTIEQGPIIVREELKLEDLERE
jgi:hypothetical protein